MSTTETKPGLLNSWKEIAAYLGRGVRTVQRWEKMGLPVCRIGFGTRAPVLAYARDIDLWVQKTQALRLAVPSPRQHLPINGSLRESMEQARLLRSQLELLREDERKSRQQLIATVVAMEKSCRAKSAVISFQSDFRPQAIDDIQPLNFLADKFENRQSKRLPGS
jgi:hypothetical protein